MAGDYRRGIGSIIHLRASARMTTVLVTVKRIGHLRDDLATISDMTVPIPSAHSCLSQLIQKHFQENSNGCLLSILASCTFDVHSFVTQVIAVPLPQNIWVKNDSSYTCKTRNALDKCRIPPCGKTMEAGASQKHICGFLRM